MRIILLGPPGSGKGTQGDLIEKKYGFPKLSTGDLLRQAVEEGTVLGKRAKASMDKGDLVADDIVVEMISKRIFNSDCQKGYILDGFPRSLSQVQRLEGMDRERPEVVIDINLSEQILIERIAGRRICSRCGAIYNLYAQTPNKEEICDGCSGKLIQRRDDKPEVIKERLKVYHKQTEPLIDYYRKKKVYYRVEGSGGIEVVFLDIRSVLDKELAKSREYEARR